MPEPRTACNLALAVAFANFTAYLRDHLGDPIGMPMAARTAELQVEVYRLFMQETGQFDRHTPLPEGISHGQEESYLKKEGVQEASAPIFGHPGRGPINREDTDPLHQPGLRALTETGFKAGPRQE